MKPGTSSQTCRRIGWTKWQRKCTQSSTNFEASWRFPGLPYILLATAKKKMAMWNVNDIPCAWDWTWVCYIFPSVTLEISTQVIHCRGQAVHVNEIFISVFFFLNFILGVVRRGNPWTVGSPQTQSVVGFRGPEISVFGLPQTIYRKVTKLKSKFNWGIKPWNIHHGRYCETCTQLLFLFFLV